jgi:drug/metabolite transporter (DMT)-like permease
MRSFPSIRPYLLMVLVALLFAGGFVSGKVTVTGVAPEIVAFARFAVAGAIMMALVAHRAPRELRLKREDVPLLFGIGLTVVAGYNLLVLWGVTMAPASDAGMIVPAVAPIMTMLLAAAFFKESLTRRQVLGAVACVLGQVLIFHGALQSSPAMPQRPLGALLFFLAALCWALYGLLGRAAAARISPLAANAWGTAFGVVILAPFALTKLPSLDPAALTPEFWAHFIYLSLGATVLGFWWYYSAVQQIGAGQASLVLNLVPVFVVAIAGVVLGEQPGMVQVAGMFIVITALIFANTQLRFRAAALPASPKTSSRSAQTD